MNEYTQSIMNDLKDIGLTVSVSRQNGRTIIRIHHARKILFDEILKIAEQHNLCLADVHSN